MLNLANLVNQFKIPPSAVETVSGFPYITTYHCRAAGDRVMLVQFCASVCRNVFIKENQFFKAFLKLTGFFCGGGSGTVLSLSSDLQCLVG